MRLPHFNRAIHKYILPPDYLSTTIKLSFQKVFLEIFILIIKSTMELNIRLTYPYHHSFQCHGFARNIPHKGRVDASLSIDTLIFFLNFRNKPSVEWRDHLQSDLKHFILGNEEKVLFRVFLISPLNYSYYHQASSSVMLLKSLLEQ